jgi:hypothetical protein
MIFSLGNRLAREGLVISDPGIVRPGVCEEEPYEDDARTLIAAAQDNLHQ